MPSVDRFRIELRAQLEEAMKRGAQTIVVNAAELHRAVGGYPGPNQMLHSCCETMKTEMVAGDEIVGDQKNYQAAALTIRYRLPHADKMQIQYTARSAELVMAK